MKSAYIMCGLLLPFSAAEGLPLHFEPCARAQHPTCYVTHAPSYDLWLSPEGVMLSQGAKKGVAIAFARTRRFNIQPEDKLEARTNYLLGDEPVNWRSNVPNYRRVRFRSVYPGIDAVFYGRDNQVEYDFIVGSGGEPQSIRLSVQGASSVELEPAGNVIIHTSFGDLRQHKPHAYQTDGAKRHSIDVHYRLLAHNQLTIEVGTYDTRSPLIIDPKLTFFDAVSGGEGRRVVLDRAGNIYIAGVVQSILFPATAGAFQPSYRGGFGCSQGEEPPGPCTDIFVSKWDPSGMRLLWATYLGGSSDDRIGGMGLDAAGNVYVAGWTGSTDFPTTPGTLQPRYSGTYFPGGHGYIAKLNPSGTALVYSTYVGGTNADSISGIVVDVAGNAYITGATNSVDFPVTIGALQQHIRGSQTDNHSNAFVAKLNSTGTALLYATYLGGSVNDSGVAIAVDSEGIANVAGNTTSPDFPVTPGAYRNLLNNSIFSFIGGGDAFIARINQTGSTLLSATYFGGSAGEQAAGIAMDASSNIYLTGVTDSRDLPVTPDALQRKIGEGTCAFANDGSVPCSDIFVAKFDPLGAHLLYSTYLGGSGPDSVEDLAVDATGSVYLAGQTASADFPTSNDAFQPCLRSNQNAFLLKFTPGGPLGYSTFLGGTSGASANGLAIDASGMYVTGSANISNIEFAGLYPSDFPPAPVPLVQLGVASLGGIFLTKLDFTGQPPPDRISCVVNGASLLGGAITPGEIVQIRGSGIGPDQVVGAQLDSNGGVSSSLAGVQVFFNEVTASLLSVQSGRIIAIVPYYLLQGALQAEIQVHYKDTTTDIFPVTLRSASPAVFSQDGSGTGQAAVLNQDGTPNSPMKPAEKGSIISLFCTGLGPSSSFGDGSINQGGLPRPTGNVLVSIGGYSADVLFAGGAPGLVAGVFQVNARVPQQAPSGPRDTVFISVDNLPSGNPGTLLSFGSPQSVTVAVR